MRVLGIDPGSQITGWGLLEHTAGRSRHVASGAIRLGSGRPLPERLLVLEQALAPLLDRYRPEVCALERIFMARNAQSALVLGHARGVIVVAMARREIPICEYSPTQVKQAVVGEGRVSKEQIQRMVAMLLAYKAPLQADEADALAIALTHTAFARFREIG